MIKLFIVIWCVGIDIQSIWYLLQKKNYFKSIGLTKKVADKKKTLISCITIKFSKNIFGDFFFCIYVFGHPKYGPKNCPNVSRCNLTIVEIPGITLDSWAYIARLS